MLEYQEEENDFELWAEMGGYAAGLPRPLMYWEKNKTEQEQDNGENDIPF